MESVKVLKSTLNGWLSVLYDKLVQIISSC